MRETYQKQFRDIHVKCGMNKHRININNPLFLTIIVEIQMEQQGEFGATLQIPLNDGSFAHRSKVIRFELLLTDCLDCATTSFVNSTNAGSDSNENSSTGKEL